MDVFCSERIHRKILIKFLLFELRPLSRLRVGVLDNRFVLEFISQEVWDLLHHHFWLLLGEVLFHHVEVLTDMGLRPLHSNEGAIVVISSHDEKVNEARELPISQDLNQILEGVVVNLFEPP